MKPNSWLNRTTLGIGLASLFSDWSHEIATTVLPAFLATLGASAVWLGAIEGLADGLSSFVKMGSGYYTDRLPRRKPIAVVGYLLTAFGTAAFALATSAWHVMAARSVAWFGRGLRTPVRKALLAASVDRDAYGRAFGFERMMDTVGAIVGPGTAVVLLPLFHYHYPSLFAVTLVPGLIAAGLIAFAVKEKERLPVTHISFGERLRALPHVFRRFLVAVGLFGIGDFSHTLLILLAAQKLAPLYGAGKAATLAAALYMFHNVCYAASAFLSGVLADRFDKRRILAGGYALSAVMGAAVIGLPPSLWSYAVIFAIGGIYVGVEEACEDSLCAELVSEEHHGMAFGTLATVNGIGDMLSSFIVGLLWTFVGIPAAFGYSAALSLIGAALVLRSRPAQN